MNTSFKHIGWGKPCSFTSCEPQLMKQMVSQLGAQTCSARFESSFCGHRCWRRAVIWCCLGPSQGRLKCFPPAERLGAGLAEAVTEQCKQPLSRTPFLHTVSSTLLKSRTEQQPQDHGLVEWDRTDKSRLQRTYQTPSPFSQPANTKVEFALLRGCKPGLALLLILGFHPSASLFFAVWTLGNIWCTDKS